MRGLGSIQGKNLSVEINSDGSYSIEQAGIPGTVIRSDVEADADSEVLRSSAYPQHKTMQSEFHDEFGSGSMLTVTHTGLPGKPDLVCTCVYTTINRGATLKSRCSILRVEPSQYRRSGVFTQWMRQSST